MSFDRSITCVFRQQPSPSVRTIDKTMVDGHGFRVPRPPTAPRGTGTTPTTRVAATQVAAAQTTAIGPFGLRSRAQVRTHARTHARWPWWYWRFPRFLPAAHPGALVVLACPRPASDTVALLALLLLTKRELPQLLLIPPEGGLCATLRLSPDPSARSVCSGSHPTVTTLINP